MEMQFRKCSICGNMVGMVNDSGAPIICCGREMETLVPNTVDASAEKHVPFIEQSGNRVTVRIGEVPHPMSEAHYIQWIALETEGGNHRKVLRPTDAPEAVFLLEDGDRVIGAYAYCNLHGLWKH